MTKPNEGQGLCHPTHQLSIRPVLAAIELGAVPDVMHGALNAAHHANRRGQPDDRIAVALPDMHVHRGLARPGHEVVLFGSQGALDGVLALEGIERLLRRGMVEPPEVHEAFAAAGEAGTAYLRDRSKATPGPSAIRRMRKRAAERGKPEPEIDRQRPERSVLALHFGSAVVHVREVQGEVTGDAVRVSTYGFSSPSSPAVLPILPDRAAHRFDDAA